MIKVIAEVTVCIIWYVSVWVGLTLAMVSIKHKAGELDDQHWLDSGSIFLLMAIWPIFAPPWFLWKGVAWLIRRVEESDDD